MGRRSGASVQLSGDRLRRWPFLRVEAAAVAQRLAEAEAAAVPLDFNVPSFVATVLEGARPVVVALLREPAAQMLSEFLFFWVSTQRRLWSNATAQEHELLEVWLPNRANPQLAWLRGHACKQAGLLDSLHFDCDFELEGFLHNRLLQNQRRIFLLQH